MSEPGSEEWRPEATAAHAPLGIRLGKDVSVGEYDSATGLTYVTRQRGRLHFNMGANAIKQAHAAAAAARAQSESEKQQDGGRVNAAGAERAEACKLLAPHLRTGMFTGLALYPEEAYYLLQRGALVIYKLEQPSRAPSSSNGMDASGGGDAKDWQELHPLSVAHFVALLVRNQRASVACLDVYAFLKENKFHPRRHREEETMTDTATVASHNQPQHYNCASADSACRFAFDVWKSSTETVYIPNEDHKPANDREVEGEVKAASSGKPADPHGNTEERRSHEAEAEAAPQVKPSLPAAATCASTTYVKRKKDTSVKKRKIKRLHLVFRVVVCRFADAMPQPRDLANLAATSGSHAPESVAHVPVKVAVVDQDQSVLFFEVGG